MDVFWVGDDGWVYVASWTAGAPWKPAERVTDAGGASKAAGIAALSRRADHREVWWVAEADSSIQGAYWYEGNLKWTRFTVPGSRDASKAAGIAALSRRADHMEVWWIHKSGSVWHSWFSESEPKRWIEQPLPVPKANDASTTGGIAVMSRSETHIEVCWVDKNGTVQHSWWTQNGGWNKQPEPVPNAHGASKTTGIAALSRSADHMEVWWVDDTSGTVKHSWWTQNGGWNKQPEPLPNATAAAKTTGIAAVTRSATDMDVWWVDTSGTVKHSWWTKDGSWAAQPEPLPNGASSGGGIAGLTRSGNHMEVWWIGAGTERSVWGAWWQGEATPAPPASQVLESSARHILKATHVLFDKPTVTRFGEAEDHTDGLTKLAAIRQFGLMPAEIEQIRHGASSTGGLTQPPSAATLALLKSFEYSPGATLQPDIAAVTGVHSSELMAVAEALVKLRTSQLRQALDMQKKQSQDEISTSAVMLNAAVVALRVLQQTSPVGMLHLERIEMVPAGIQRGELVATIPLAPGEQTAVTHKEWSVTSREFTTIVTDELEQISETGVTDNTDLAQSTSSQSQHANQFNITGTVQGGIPIISGSTTTTVAGQDSTSRSATNSIKHSRSLTEKASSRARREHKITISTKTETGTEATSTRIIKNREKHPIRIDYFNLMRQWRVRLYRYGLRLTYDVIVPEPAAGLRQAYARLAELRRQQKPFVFEWKHSDISEKLGKVDPSTGEWKEDATGDTPKFQWIADKYGAPVKPYPAEPSAITLAKTGGDSGTWNWWTYDFDPPQDAEVKQIEVTAKIGKLSGALNFQVLGSDLFVTVDPPTGAYETTERILLNASKTNNFMSGQRGKFPVMALLANISAPSVTLKAVFQWTNEAKERWRNEVYTTIRDMAYQRYVDEQQDIAAAIAELEERLVSVDTLSLRRQENDEIMKSVLRWILPEFGYMPQPVLTALKELMGYSSLSDAEFDKLVTPGTLFDDIRFDTAKETQWATVGTHRDKIRFINQAIEWENVVTFLYSYFWDIPTSWSTIRELRHPDATRQAFLRAGAARVVLTVRKDWERRWMAFTKDPSKVPEKEPGDAEFPIAAEIAAYDDRHYPGIPPANPGRSAVRLQDAVYTTCSVKISAGATKIPVESSAGFVIGLQVLLDSVESKAQEEVLITAIPTDKEISVESVKNDHNGTQTPFAILQPGEKGALIAEWNEYTPSSGTDIAVTSNLTSVYSEVGAADPNHRKDGRPL